MSLLNYCIRPLLRHFGRTLPIERGRTGKSILRGFLRGLADSYFRAFFAGKYWNLSMCTELNYETWHPLSVAKMNATIHNLSGNSCVSGILTRL